MLTHVTDCLPFDASAAQVQNAINGFGIDFDRDGQLTFRDRDHVNVTRRGDGTAASGFGYRFTVNFAGRQRFRGVSAALGDVAPLRVVATGTLGGCADVRARAEQLLPFTVDTNASAGAVHVDPTAPNGRAAYDVRTHARPGDVVRIEGSRDPFQLYTIKSIDARQPLALTELFDCSKVIDTPCSPLLYFHFRF
jgi:hypothetical protein